MQQLITKIIACYVEVVDYSYVNGMLRYKGKLYVGSNGELRSKLVRKLHQNGGGGGALGQKGDNEEGGTIFLLANTQNIYN